MNSLNSLLINLDQTVVVLDKEGKILLFNDVAEALRGSLLTQRAEGGSNWGDLTDLRTSLLWMKSN